MTETTSMEVVNLIWLVGVIAFMIILNMDSKESEGDASRDGAHFVGRILLAVFWPFLALAVICGTMKELYTQIATRSTKG